MTTFFIYILEVIVCSALFTGYYWWVLRNGNYYRWNRLFINTSVVLSIVIPLLNISIPASPIVMPTYNYVVSYITTDNATATTVPVQSGIPPISWANLCFIAYMLVAFILLIKEFVSLFHLVMLKRHAERIHTNEVTLYCIDNNTAPFTFFQTIFWGKDISIESGKGPYMLHHELAHVRLGHSWDKALMQFVCCIFWMNPFFILLRRELELVHEFEADRESLGEGNIEELSSLILCTMYPNHYHDFTSRFFQSSIKRRILMITKNEKSKLSMMRKICVIPVLLITLLAFSVRSESFVTPGSNNNTEGISQDTTTRVQSIAIVEVLPENPWTPQNELEAPIMIIGYPARTTSDTKEISVTSVVIYPRERKSPPNGVFLYNDVEVKPKFESSSALSYFTKNIRYPVIAAEKGIAGEVIASYIVNENGKVDNIEVEVNPDQSLANEIIRALRTSPDWIPGKQNGKNVPVQCYIFTKFRLQQ